nr:MAG TPA: hypothetical protein [Caudoviricetes sp.]
MRITKMIARPQLGIFFLFFAKKMNSAGNKT